MLVCAGVGWKPGVINEVLVSAQEDSPEGLTLKQGAVISPDINREQRFSYHEFLKDHGVQAFVNVLILSDKARPAYGVFQVDSRSPREFHQSDIEFLRTYANLLGAAINRFRIVDELRTALRDKELLIHELNHRVKNTLATVQSITFQTLRNAPSPEQAASAIENRLRALSLRSRCAHPRELGSRQSFRDRGPSSGALPQPRRTPYPRPRLSCPLAAAHGAWPWPWRFRSLRPTPSSTGRCPMPLAKSEVHWELSSKEGGYHLGIGGKRPAVRSDRRAPQAWFRNTADRAHRKAGAGW